MNKLYARRDKRTGEFLKDKYHQPIIYQSVPKVPKRREDVWELVTFREEPTEPCKWCGDTMLGQVDRLIPYETWPGETEYEPDTLFAQNWQFCPNCGRSLK